MSVPLVSICLPNLNTRPFLEERMATLLGQTLTDWELIVCDSHSNDGAWEYFQKFSNDQRVHLHQVPRAGIYAGWNECLRRAQGEYIYIATSDDTATPRLLETMVGAMAAHPDVEMATCNFSLIDDQGKPYNDPDSPYGKEIYGDWYQQAHRRHGPSEFVATCAGFTTWNTINSVLMRRSLLQKTGLFREGRSSLYDYEWGLKACLCTDTIHVPETLAAWRVHSGQATHKTDHAKQIWTYISMIDDVFQTMADRVPGPLKTPSIRHRLLQPRLIAAFNTLQLYPSTLIRSPWRFTRNLVRGFTSAPALTVRHLARGMCWRNRPQLALRLYLDELLGVCQLPPVCRQIEDAPRK